MGSALGAVAEAADQAAADQRQIGRTARALERLRDRGRTWTEIFGTEEGPRLVALLRRSVSDVRAATSRFIAAVVEGLAEEGQSRRAIASKLGVSHQRISRLIGANGAPRPSPDE